MTLPDDPDLGWLRNRARDLQRAVRAGAADALATAAAHHPDPVVPDGWKLSAAQLVVARGYGFRSWPALVRHVNVIAEHRSAPDQAPESADPATEFLRRACLTYSPADHTSRAVAQALLAAHPNLPDDDVCVAAACADPDALARHLHADPTRAVRRGGPHRWPPIAYLAYARHDPTLGRDAVEASAGLLLDHGADPNTGFLWHGLIPPFTLVTGAFGEGEQGPVAQPPHPQCRALAEVLLRAGADPNDGQALYNRMFRPADDHLELLFGYGLGTGDGGPWRRRLGGRTDSPTELLRGQLAWAVTHGFTHRVALLAEHGVDLTAPLRRWGTTGRTPYQAARTAGQFAVVEQLRALGAVDEPLSPEDAVFAAVLAGDRAAVAATDPDVLARTRARRPGLVVWAAVRGDTDAVRLAVESGWDVSARARTDLPGDDEWETALHHTAANGDVALTRLLLDLGADPTVADHRFHGTPLNWAEHFGQSATAAMLSPGGDTPEPDHPAP